MRIILTQRRLLTQSGTWQTILPNASRLVEHNRISLRRGKVSGLISRQATYGEPNTGVSSSCRP